MTIPTIDVAKQSVGFAFYTPRTPCSFTLGTVYGETYMGEKSTTPRLLNVFVCFTWMLYETGVLHLNSPGTMP